MIGEKGLRELVPNSNILGLTATPTYTDKARRGWLWKIFTDGDNGVIYQADKEILIAQGILARPHYIEVSTGINMEVDDKLYDRLVKQHKDLPEEIIEILADNRHKNNFIVNSYVSNKDTYGKTIIFADRWFQCEYIKTKLVEKGIKADAIYSRIDADPGSAEARNQHKSDDNKKILDDFRNNKLDVLINVRKSFTLESEQATRTITRIVNLFYHCQAVYKVDWEVYTYTYNIYLYPNNKPEWLLQHKAELLNFVQDRLGRQAKDIKVTTKK